MISVNSYQPRVRCFDLGEGLGSEEGLDSQGASQLCGKPSPGFAGLSPEALALGGAALAQGLMLALDPDKDPFILSVGSAVARGLPTAARTTVSARSPLTGGLAEGQVGSDFGRRLAGVCDALVLLGVFAEGDGVLVLDGEGTGTVHRRPHWLGLSARERNAQMVQDFGQGAGLSAGPAAQAGVRHAHLAAGHDPPSFVGRGGLGRALAQHGLLGVFAQAQPVASKPSAELSRALLESPRLLERSLGGTLELFDEAGVASGQMVDAPTVSDSQRHGCRGCPTPCGIVLRDGAGPGVGTMRFSALQPLLGSLAQDSAEALGVLEVCNRLGLDVREAARDLEASSPFEDQAQATAALEQLVRDGEGPMRSASIRSAVGLLGQVGPLASARGADPMRSFPFLGEGNSDSARLAALAPDIDWGQGLLNPDESLGKGFLAAWHEDLVAALDALGFCTFSAAGLLADGVMSLDALALALVPEFEAKERPGVALRELGGEIARAAHMLLAHWDAPAVAVNGGDSTPLAALLEEYRSWRGLDGRGRPTCEPVLPKQSQRAQKQGPDQSQPPIPRGAQPAQEISETESGWVEFNSRGLLAEHLGSTSRVQLDLPAFPSAVLAALALENQSAAWLLRDRAGIALPAIWRAGVPLGPGSLVFSGDQLDLVLVIPGG